MDAVDARLSVVVGVVNEAAWEQQQMDEQAQWEAEQQQDSHGERDTGERDADPD